MDNLLNQALQHRAVDHPYLRALRDGKFNNMDLILKDFAVQYGAYSEWFPKYLSTVISKLTNPKHKEHLMDNLSEEKGNLHKEDIDAIKKLGIKEEWVQGITHCALFERFQNALGVSPVETIGHEVKIWRKSFLNLIEEGGEETGVGAIGLGTESIVKHVYKYIIEAIENHSDLHLKDYVFFPLHTEVDDEHGLILLEIAKEMTSSGPEAMEQLKTGMFHALDLRATFWDNMMVRAKSNELAAISLA
jgi:pyrroloquinoline quinone (PQQ) biosynthesis protein C